MPSPASAYGDRVRPGALAAQRNGRPHRHQVVQDQQLHESERLGAAQVGGDGELAQTAGPQVGREIEEAIWDRLHFASHLRTERLGEFTVGTELHRSEPLAITQLLVLYQLVTARAAVALGASGARADQAPRLAPSPAA